MLLIDMFSHDFQNSPQDNAFNTGKSLHWKMKTVVLSKFINEKTASVYIYVLKCRFLACTGWCKTLGFLMFVKPEGLPRDIKKLMFCIIQCKLKIWISILIFTFYMINQICHTILRPAPLVTLLKLFYL